MLRPPIGPRAVAKKTPLAKPSGIAVAVVFDWAVAALPPSALALTLLRGQANPAVVVTFALLIALLSPPLIALGEALRRGMRLARVIQIGLSALLLLINAFILVRDLAALTQGVIPRSTSLPSVLANLWILWGLTREPTVRWFDETTTAGARRRHGRRWLVLAALASLVTGMAAALLNTA